MPYTKKQKADWYQKNRKRLDKKSFEWKKNNPEKVAKLYSENRKKIAEKARERRIIVLRYYSNGLMSCACCGERTLQFLSIDHKNGGGNKHHQEIFKGKKGGNISWWLIKNNFPDGFQVLCHNCNMAKGFYGRCPHKV